MSRREELGDAVASGEENMEVGVSEVGEGSRVVVVRSEAGLLEREDIDKVKLTNYSYMILPR